ncbi:ATG9A protein, partial [Nyctiprogne leucopyga]|nr:ATG9A protein [Nyctiprogne leucopyga]
IYHFHQKNGFACMVLADLFELGQFLFIVTFTTFLLCCVDYDVLFANRPLNHSQAGGATPDRPKVTLPDAILPPAQWCPELAGGAWWCQRRGLGDADGVGSAVPSRAVPCRAVPSRAVPCQSPLCLAQEGLWSHSWQEVQQRLVSLQRRQQLCVPRRELTELDIHHRILRFHNYTVAMVSQELLPLRFRLPLLGSAVFLTRGLQYNLELLLFWGPGSLFQNQWSLRPQCKRASARREVARRL